MLLSKWTIISQAYPAYLIGWRPKEAGTCQIQVTDGRDGDSVVGVIVLHRLRRADYRVLQVILILLCSVGHETKAISETYVCKCCSSRLPVFISPRASCLSFSILTYSVCRWKESKQDAWGCHPHTWSNFNFCTQHRLPTDLFSDSDLLFPYFLSDFCHCCFPPLHLSLVKSC